LSDNVVDNNINPVLLKRSIPLMTEQTKRMQSLIEDLLVLSRLESSGHVLREEPVNIPDILRALYYDALALSAQKHQILLEIESARWVKGAEDELRSAMSNLVSNAIRYTPAGGTVRLMWSERHGEAWFSVRDSGIGIAVEHIPRLTERFYRVDRGRSRETGGTGLGLAIVKHVIVRHQARLDITSELGQGSCFSVVFGESRLMMPTPTVPMPEINAAAPSVEHAAT
jgi:two-component system phosphate regulon sensor histidine kinase PhoR